MLDPKLIRDETDKVREGFRRRGETDANLGRVQSDSPPASAGACHPSQVLVRLTRCVEERVPINGSRGSQGGVGMIRRFVITLSLAVSLLVGGASAALAHGGSVAPSGTGVCTNLNVHENGNGSAAAAGGGLGTASVSGVVAWTHC